MSEVFFILFVVMGMFVVIGLLIYGHVKERERRELLAAKAAYLGLSFVGERDRELPQRFHFLSIMGRGSNRYAQNIFQGTYKGETVLCFDYHYQVTRKSGKSSSTTHYHHAVYSILLPLRFPGLKIAPENILTRLAAAIGFGDIEFESAEFSRTFRVTGGDKKFAYDFCHPRMMEFLLLRPRTNLELEGDLLCLIEDGKIEFDGLVSRLDLLAEIKNLIPSYLLDIPART